MTRHNWIWLALIAAGWIALLTCRAVFGEFVPASDWHLIWQLPLH